MNRRLWTREEIILALDLFYKIDDVQEHKPDNPLVINLSNFLKMNFHPMNIHSNVRSPAAVCMKLDHFRYLLGRFGGGLRAGGHLDRIIWEKYCL